MWTILSLKKFHSHIPNLKNSYLSRQWQLDAISEIAPRWFGLRDCAFELFFSNGQTEMFAFEGTVQKLRLVDFGRHSCLNLNFCFLTDTGGLR